MEEEELHLELDTQEENLKRNNYQNRLKDLSEKNKLTIKERDELAEAKAKVEAERETLAKERDFFKDFSATSAKYPNATEYQDAILEKVKGGYTVEDATISILAKEGKFQPAIASIPRENPAGGSATNTLKGDGEKGIGEMTQAERRAKLEKDLNFS